jgi:hypothetical protein
MHSFDTHGPVMQALPLREPAVVPLHELFDLNVDVDSARLRIHATELPHGSAQRPLQRQARRPKRHAQPKTNPGPKQARVSKKKAVSIPENQKFKCPYADCKAKPYARIEHLKRHMDT